MTVLEPGGIAGRKDKCIDDCGTFARAWRRARDFRRDEGGALILFALFIFILMLLIGGMAVDFMRFETTRTKIQNTVDRAVLAAASLNQTRTPAEVVQDYFDKAGLGGALEDVIVDEGINHRKVQAIAKADINTFFLHMSGINTLSAPGGGTAEEKVTNVEISLVLDISGSMGRASSTGGTKIELLRDAAKDFVDAVLQDDSADKISLSLITYSAQVNAGPDIFNQMNVLGSYINATHNYSHCIEFETADFDTTALDLSKTYRQGQHFSPYDYYDPDGTLTYTNCPKYERDRIRAFSQDKNELKAQIDDLEPEANTAIHMGMKWGTALLDPSTRPIVSGLIGMGKVDNVFSGRPADYSDEDTLKVIVLMTDGENVNTLRVKSTYYNSIWEYNYWNTHKVPWSSTYLYYKYTASQADDMLESICDAAKAKNITVYTVGFEVGEHGADVMENCATQPSHFFRVEGIEIAEAFQAIANDINRLRLTQ